MVLEYRPLFWKINMPVWCGRSLAVDKEIRVLILINLYEIEAVFESHVACFVDIIPESLIAYP
jgi:hypothetical protein